MELTAENLYPFQECVSSGIESLSQHAVPECQKSIAKGAKLPAPAALLHEIPSTRSWSWFFPQFSRLSHRQHWDLYMGDEALDLNSCSMSLYSSLLHEDYVGRGDMASCYRPRNVNLSFPLCPYWRLSMFHSGVKEKTLIWRADDSDGQHSKSRGAREVNMQTKSWIGTLTAFLACPVMAGCWWQCLGHWSWYSLINKLQESGS